MKSTGVVRKLDDLGRITLPIELRRNLNIGEHDPLEIFVDDDRIILRKYEASDIFTGNMDELIDFHDKKVSKQSIMEMARLAGLHVIIGIRFTKSSSEHRFVAFCNLSAYRNLPVLSCFLYQQRKCLQQPVRGLIEDSCSRLFLQTFKNHLTLLLICWKKTLKTESAGG